MPRGPLYEDSYWPQLSGHETFPLRYGWLKKAFDAVSGSEVGRQDNRHVFMGPHAIAEFGVGKNMVASMRHWATAAGIIIEAPDTRHIETTPLGQLLFGRGGLDPYMEEPATSWLVHWNLAGQPTKTTWFWAFNHYPAVEFERDGLVQAIGQIAKERGWPRAAHSTIKNDVACFLLTYVTSLRTEKSNHEEALESPLTELGLIKQTTTRDRFRFVRGPKPTLRAGVFGYALTQFWNERFPSNSTLSFESLAHEAGSPGRVFLLDENDLLDKLSNLEHASGGAYRWSETAGLKQVLRDSPLDLDATLGLLARDYSSVRRRGAA